MYKVLIVDDELLIRELIKKSVDFPSLGFQIAGEAKEGRQAMKMIEDLQPNLLLLDINIPIMNGITLAQSVHKKYPDIQIIILTGHSQFDYAKGAIKAGVLEYLLKPLNDHELIKALLKAKDILSQRTTIHKTLSNYQNQKLRLDKEDLFRRLIDDTEDFSSLDLTPLTNSGVSPNKGRFQMASIIIDNLDELFLAQSEKQLWKFAVSNITQELLDPVFQNFVFQDDEKRIIIVVTLPDADSENLFSSCCHQICHVVQSTLHFTVTLGISNPFQGLYNLPDAYNKSLQALEHRFLLGNARCIFQHDFPALPAPSNNQNDSTELLLKLRSGRYETAYTLIEGSLADQKNRNEMIFQAIRILSDLVLFLKERRIYHPNFHLDYLLEQLLSFELSVDLRQYVLDCFLEAEKLLSGSQPPQINQIVNTAMEHIHAHYADNTLSLSEIANTLFVNSSYLSHLFKQETGISLSNYLTRIRLKEAKRLLEDTNSPSSLSWIANSVGYKDEYYFNKCFKKLYGISPKKYAEKRRSDSSI